MKSKLFKSLLLVVAAIALVVTTVFATMAYMTATSKVTNAFSIGNVTVKIFESHVNEDGTIDSSKPKDAIANTYRLLPGKEYSKDPSIYVDAKSDACYLFVRVQNDIANIEADGNKMSAQMVANGWKEYTTLGNDVIYVYAKNATDYATEIAKDDENKQEFPLFTKFSVKTDANITDALTSAKVDLTAYAVQSAGFGTVGSKTAIDAAWAALVDQYSIA